MFSSNQKENPQSLSQLLSSSPPQTPAAISLLSNKLEELQNKIVGLKKQAEVVDAENRFLVTQNQALKKEVREMEERVPGHVQKPKSTAGKSSDKKESESKE